MTTGLDTAKRLKDIDASIDWEAAQTAAGGYDPELNVLAAKHIENSLPPDGEEAPRPLLTCLAGVAPTAVTWLWPRRIPRGVPSILFGDPGLGKTHVALDIVTRVSLGAAWPDGGRAPLGNVVVMSGEDDWATTIVPRLNHGSADLNRIYGFPAVEAFDEKGRRTFSLTDHAAILEREILSVKAVLAMVDPLSCFLGGVNTHQTSDVRVALSLLADVAARSGAAILCILHPNKDESSGAAALNRLSGSGAFGAAARSVMAVAADQKDDADERRLLLPVKSNMARMPDGLGYRIVSTDPDTCDSGIAWDTDPVEVDANEAFGRTRPDTPAMTRAKAFLKRVLAGGEPYPSKVLEEQAEAEGVKPRTLKRAKAGIGVISEKDGFGSGTAWTCRLEAEQ
jgi:putative DNA primase/helicase